MSVLNKSNFKKTVYFIQRNGIRKTWFAVWERLWEHKKQNYTFHGLTEEERKNQRENNPDAGCISILVPCYETQPEYLKALIESVLAQTYQNWQLVLADSSHDYAELNTALSGPVSPMVRTVVSDVVKKYSDDRITYVHLAKNYGIAGNTNCGIERLTGSFTAFMDHDDVLTEDALFRVAEALVNNPEAMLLYSDEDKCDGNMTSFFEPHYKLDFDKDLLLTNNYICHLCVVKTDILRRIRLKETFDGSQDFKFALDVLSLAEAEGKKPEEVMVHIPYILYHWRFHVSSTAANPKSKLYAYVSGQKAIQSYCDEHGYAANVTEQEHVGHYYVEYKDGIFQSRPDVGAVCNYIYRFGRIQKGPILEDGKYEFHKMRRGYLGYMCRAASQHTVYAADLSSLIIRPELLSEVTEKLSESGIVDSKAAGIFVCEYLKEKGYRIICDPRLQKKQQ